MYLINTIVRGLKIIFQGILDKNVAQHFHFSGPMMDNKVYGYRIKTVAGKKLIARHFSFLS